MRPLKLVQVVLLVGIYAVGSVLAFGMITKDGSARSLRGIKPSMRVCEKIPSRRKIADMDDERLDAILPLSPSQASEESFR
jgi:hypothetical protein